MGNSHFNSWRRIQPDWAIPCRQMVYCCGLIAVPALSGPGMQDCKQCIPTFVTIVEWLVYLINVKAPNAYSSNTLHRFRISVRLAFVEIVQ
jgi:hypothetical protein